MPAVMRAIPFLLAAVTVVTSAHAPAPLATSAQASTAATGRWTEARAQQWYSAQPWLVGANYNPASAINQLEMWQADTFDPKAIDRELGWAAGIGMNTMRVFLHDLL